MTLHYTSGTVLMADDVCDALLRYAQALAATQGSDVVAVPILDGDGDATAEFLLGPASQLFATPLAEGSAEPTNDAVVADLERRIRATLPTAQAEDAAYVASADWELDLG